MAGIVYKDKQEEAQTLGSFLRDHRTQKGASLADVAEETKISLPVLVAIEEDNYERMPAMAFCRGFYSLYAEYLELDAKEILRHYSQNMSQQGKGDKKQARPPLNKSQSFNSFLEPSSISPVTGRAFFLVLCLFTLVGACLYFNWNPIHYFSDILNTQPKAVAQQEETQVPDTLHAPAPPSTNARTNEQTPESTSGVQATTAPYNLEIHFLNSGTLKVTLDDGFILDKHFTAGTSLQYQVKKSITLDMPATIEGKIQLNGINIPLPEVENGRRRLSLPEDLLD